jgi:hypothetical protein
MLAAADALEFEKAAMLRDRIQQLKDSPTLFDASSPSAGKGEPKDLARNPNSKRPPAP